MGLSWDIFEPVHSSFPDNFDICSHHLDEGFSRTADDGLDIMRVFEGINDSWAQGSWGPVTRSSDLDRKHLNRSR